MDTRKPMLRMIRRGLLLSPIKGFKYLQESMATVRRGPVRKSKPTPSINE